MKRLIFDFDGTLAASTKQWEDKMISVLKKHGISYPENIIEIITPLGDKATAEYYINALGLDLSVQGIIDEFDSYALNEYTYNIVLKETVLETLLELKKTGYSLNILSASPHKWLDVCLKRNKIYKLFDNIWSCDDFETTKADVNIYHMAAQRLETTTENCIYFDDCVTPLKTAKQSGMWIVGVFDESRVKDENEIKLLSNQYIYKLSDYLD